MNLVSVTSLVLLGVGASQAADTLCPERPRYSRNLTSTLKFSYEMVIDENNTNILCGLMESWNEGYLSFGVSPSGKMHPAECLIGLPDEGTVLKYNMTSLLVSGVNLMPEEQQTLRETSITQEDGVTIMKFGKIMEEDEFHLYPGDNRAIFAESEVNEFGDHYNHPPSFRLRINEPDAPPAVKAGVGRLGVGIASVVVAGTMAALFGM